MWTIRQDQFAVFEQIALADFMATAVQHLRDDLPQFTQYLTDAQLQARVRSAMTRAAQYGIEDEPDVIAFLDVTFLLEDERFDANPAHEWAREILNEPAATPTERAEMLYQVAAEARRAVEADSTDA